MTDAMYAERIEAVMLQLHAEVKAIRESIQSIHRRLDALTPAPVPVKRRRRRLAKILQFRPIGSSC